MFLSSWIHFHWGMRVEKYFHLRKLTLHFRMQPTMPVFLSPRMTYPYPWKTLPSTKKQKNANHNFGSVWQIRRKQYCYWRIPSPSERHTEVYYNASPTGKSSVAPLLPFLSLLPPTTTQAHTPKKKNTIVTENPFFFVNRGAIMEMKLNMQQVLQRKMLAFVILLWPFFRRIYIARRILAIYSSPSRINPSKQQERWQ